jgi:hypothetical protein
MTCTQLTTDRHDRRDHAVACEGLKDRILEVDRRYRSGDIDFFAWSRIMASVMRLGSETESGAVVTSRAVSRLTGAVPCSPRC